MSAVEITPLSLLFLAMLAAAQPVERPNGVLLVAKPGLTDPNFRETVVLVTQTPDAQTIGVILNRPTERKLSDETVFFGGPVLRETIVALFQSREQPESPAFQVLRGVYLTMQPDSIERLLARRGQRFRLYAGFSGWAPLQLQAELGRDDWYVLPASVDLLFRKDTAGLWSELLAAARGEHAAEERKSPARAALFHGGLRHSVETSAVSIGRREKRCAAAYTLPMKLALRSLVLLAAFALAAPALSQSQEDAILLVAHPAFRDLEYRQTVLIAAPAPNGGHVGVILNRPTKRSLGSLFPEHEPSKKVVDPVYYGGPFSRGALVALVKADNTPGTGAMLLMKNVYLAFRANTIDHVIETTPNEARYFVGYVGWRPGELKSEIDRGLWSVLDADVEVVFRKDTDGMWEDLLQATRRIRAAAPAALQRASFSY
jgi:putative transcriptional regulator